MIRSSKSTLKFSNKNKLDKIDFFIEEYKRVSKIFIDKLLDLEKVPTLLPKELTSDVETWLSARTIQCLGKQTSGIVRGTKVKQQRRLFIINKFKEQGKFKKARKLQKIYNNINQNKPNIENLECELDERFVKIDSDNKTSFDIWLTLTSLGNKLKIGIPIKKTKHFNKILKNGKLKKGIRLSKNEITFIFDLEEPKKVETGNVVGIDIGKTDLFYCSNGIKSKEDNHGYSLDKIINKISEKKRGSVNFRKSQTHRKNFVNWSINQLNLNNVKQINIENIKNLRKGFRTSRKLSHWNYPQILDKLEDRCNLLGVQVNRLNPTYTSQRCNKCGWVRKSNRTKKKFRCGTCSYECDSDYNASVNLSFNLSLIGEQERLKQNNRTGFYWKVLDKESIVPCTQKTNNIDFCNERQ